MSRFDSEISSLRARLAALEEQKIAEEKRVSPLKALETIISDKRKLVTPPRGCHFKSVTLERLNEQDKLAFLEPIFTMLQDIQTRLEALEKK